MRVCFLCALILAATALCAREIALLPDGSLHLTIFDVGQGDALLLVTPSGKQIVVDGGPDLSLLQHLGNALPFFDRTIDLLVLTHPDADHITALPDVARRYRVERVLMTAAAHDSGRYEALLTEISAQRIPVIIANAGTDIAMSDGVILDVVWPESAEPGIRPKSSNDFSVVVRALYAHHAILLTGDIERRTEEAILRSGTDIAADVLKVPHHGSKTSSSSGFLLSVQPARAIVSAGKDNPFGHPHREIIERYRSLGIVVTTTPDSGTISMEFP